MQPPEYFEETRKKAAQRWEQLESDPELAAPWHQLFKQVQSPRHVVSELLQNADDANAVEACVEIHNSEFVFSHNGDDFERDHFGSLCRFGYSNKRELHTIGFRGIGFKSTFSLGGVVRLQTPTLSVAFNRKRFTEPIWLETLDTSELGTTLRVLIQDEQRRNEIEKNLTTWLASPSSLLFFRTLRHLRIGNEEVVWTSAGEGPIPDSEWMSRGAKSNERVLLIRSALEEFPIDAIAEIRQERMLSDIEEAKLPPCKVEIVLGLEGRLFVVLPTGVNTSLPFACNAPFVQDPARLKIKDPATSPTNRWLLERAGRLAAQAMLKWLEREDLTEQKRVEAYALLASKKRNKDTIESSCEAIVSDAFYRELRGHHFLLTQCGRLVGEMECFSVPHWLTTVWEERQLTNLFDDQKRPLFSLAVKAQTKAVLVKQGHLAECSLVNVLALLRDKQFPRPKTWSGMLALWNAVAPAVNTRKADWKTIRIVPVQGRDLLYASHEVARISSNREMQSSDDWEFLSQYLLVMDPAWYKYLNDQSRINDTSEDDQLGSQLTAAFSVMQMIGLGQSSDASQIMDRVSLALSEQREIPASNCIRIAQIAAKLDAKASHLFQFVTQSGTRTTRQTTSPLIADARFDLDSIAPSEWCQEHTLHCDYWSNFLSCTAAEWADWISFGQSGLAQFIPLEQKDEPVYGREDLTEVLHHRGYDGEITAHYKSLTFAIVDWDYPDELWSHWTVLAQNDKTLWGRLVSRILEQPKYYWNESLVSQVVQISQSKARKEIDGVELVPSWILRLRTKPCLQDSWGQWREPAELMVRTPATQSLLDVESFIRPELDTPAARPLLTRLGVRDTPTGPERLLERLQVLANIPNAPVAEVQKWCSRIDLILATCSTKELLDIETAFNSQRLIFTTAGVWAKSTEVFLNSDEFPLPATAIVHEKLQHLALWQRVGVRDRPTTKIILDWLGEIPTHQPLSAAHLNIVKETIIRHPHRVWTESRCWLSLDGQWVPTKELRFYVATPQIGGWSHLFATIRREVADFAGMPSDTLRQLPFSGVVSLESRLEERVNSDGRGCVVAQPKPWLKALGECLSRIVTDSIEKTQRIRGEGRRLMRTIWKTSRLLETVPYLDGTPVGTARSRDVLWEGETLFILDRPLTKMLRHIARELARPFDDCDVEDAIKFCVDRTPEQVNELLEQTFTLAARQESEPAISQSIKLSADPSVVRAGGDVEEVPNLSVADAGNVYEQSDDDSADEKWSREIDEDYLETDGELRVRQAESRNPGSSKRPLLIDGFAKMNGFKKEVLREGYYHRDGRLLQRAHGRTFPWEIYSRAGELLKSLLVNERCFTLEPIEISAEAWEECRKYPDTRSIVMTNPNGSPLEISGQRLLDLQKEGRVALYPANYRLVYQASNSPSQNPK